MHTSHDIPVGVAVSINGLRSSKMYQSSVSAPWSSSFSTCCNLCSKLSTSCNPNLSSSTSTSFCLIASTSSSLCSMISSLSKVSSDPNVLFSVTITRLSTISTLSIVLSTSSCVSTKELNSCPLFSDYTLCILSPLTSSTSSFSVSFRGFMISCFNSKLGSSFSRSDPSWIPELYMIVLSQVHLWALLWPLHIFSLFSRLVWRAAGWTPDSKTGTKWAKITNHSSFLEGMSSFNGN